MRISVIVTTGSTEINSELRADCLWRMVNSAHVDPGHPFEMIIVDNCHGDGPHRTAIDEIFRTYKSVTHLIRNRINERHGGGVNQGIAVADGDIIVQTVDDLEFKAGWLEAVVRPLIYYGSPEKTGKGKWLIGAILKGHNATGERVGSDEIDGLKYQIRTNAAAYLWAFWRNTFNAIGPWRRMHFADTRWSRKLQSLGYQFILPCDRYAVETNLNYMRPWRYHKDRHISAKQEKELHLESIWRRALDLYSRKPHFPTRKWPLRMPKHLRPTGDYPTEWIESERRKYLGDDACTSL